jgi:hypothetical protein
MCSVVAMAQDPEIVHLYANAKEAYEAATSGDAGPDDPVALEARERFRESLAAYILDLEVNGMSVPHGLTDEMARLEAG